jgi:hypothetical protein
MADTDYVLAVNGSSTTIAAAEQAGILPKRIAFTLTSTKSAVCCFNFFKYGLCLAFSFNIRLSNKNINR